MLARAGSMGVRRPLRSRNARMVRAKRARVWLSWPTPVCIFARQCPSYSRRAAFQADPGVVAAIVGITAAGVGLSFTAAAFVIFAELHWTPGCILQAEDRGAPRRGVPQLHAALACCLRLLAAQCIELGSSRRKSLFDSSSLTTALMLCCELSGALLRSMVFWRRLLPSYPGCRCSNAK